jgi:hypothetical protein
MALVAEIDEAPAGAAGPAEAASDLGDVDEAVDEDRLIGVMDRASPTGSSEMDFGDRALEPVAESRPFEPVAESRPLEPVAESRPSSGSLLQAIPALRPVAAWLNHGNGNEQDDKKSE